ncbi:MAG TPA: hypothetical protein VK255_03935 [Patescibacteria group bacterium]|nr:hypothetical protein [Patescibacteria group bacterium]
MIIDNELLYTFHIFAVAFYHTWWVILPVALYWIFKIIYFDFIAFRSPNSFHRGLKWMFLEVIPPKEVERGPKPMEFFFQSISAVTSTPNTFTIWKEGRYTQDRFSFEIFGENGQAHFIIRTLAGLRNFVEANIYAHYPDAEVKEVEDYTLRFPKIIPNRDWTAWGTDFEFTNPQPMPIKTYDKFEEDITGTAIDPMSALMEVIGTLPPDQYIWLQYAVEPAFEKWNLEDAQKKVLDVLKKKEVPLKLGFLDHIMDVFRNFFRAFVAPPEFSTVQKKDEQPLEFRLSPGEKEVLKATEENLGKVTFKTKMRFIYLGKRDGFRKSFVTGTIGAMKQFNDINYNQVKPQEISKTYARIFFKEQIIDFRIRKIIKRYRDRDPTGVKITLSTKEMATVYHFPDMGVKSPSVPRVASKLGTAPPNLPVK